MALSTLKGVNAVAFARKLSDASTKEAELIPWQTTLSFDPSRDSNSTVTKDGNVNTQSSVSTDLEIEFINNTSAIADAFYDSLFDGDKIEFWIVHKDRKNAEGKYFSWYAQTSVSEDSNDNDADADSNRDVTFSVDGTPKRGWTTLTDQQSSDIDYVFRGLDIVTGTGSTETNGGTAWDKATDGGVNGGTAPAGV
ncbi:phage major tail protein, TP901-1 family [Leuconostoc falkenbergense]|uniref:phage major tail protein, TP901-1 family n=1 Tax=Leuconostoc falkenbergense TaxID=2766470 RepID=UPI0024A9CD97|nr:phage major tail protein, TP901-1 family [Leuconostoc falkenbergense]MDI6553094.1 phage major tail protein, TP901-1 family [Leuconostoc falkenbergense]